MKDDMKVLMSKCNGTSPAGYLIENLKESIQPVDMLVREGKLNIYRFTNLSHFSRKDRSYETHISGAFGVADIKLRQE